MGHQFLRGQPLTIKVTWPKTLPTSRRLPASKAPLCLLQARRRRGVLQTAFGSSAEPANRSNNNLKMLGDGRGTGQKGSGALPLAASLLASGKRSWPQYEHRS